MSARALHCQKQVKRLSGLPSPFGSDRKMLDLELAAALARHASGDDHATRIVAHLIEATVTCPTPSQILSASQEVQVNATALPEPCERCQPDGGYWVQQRAIKNLGLGMHEYHYSGRCNCRRGRELSNRDRDLQHMTAKDYCVA